MTLTKAKIFWKRHCIGILSFLIPVVLMMIIFITRKIYPFGEESFLHIDMYHQYFPFLMEFYNKVKEGDSLLYSWNTGIGSNFIALFAYYLATPTNWLSILFPKEYLIEFMSYMVIFKIGMCGVTFSYYLRKHFKSEHIAIVFFSLFYAMSGYVAAYNWNVMWFDGLILAPLILLGLEALVMEGKTKLYCIALGLAIFSNFYLCIMICIYLVLYFMVLLVSSPDWKKAVGKFFLYSLLAGGMAAIMILPEMAALKFTEFTNTNFPSSMNTYFSVIDVLSRHSIHVEVETGLDHWPNIYCGVFVFFLMPLYILDKKIPSKEKIGKLILLAFLVISFSTNILNFIWHGFNYPNSLPARQSFLYIILLLTLCFESFRRLREYSKAEITQSFCFVLFFIMLCEELAPEEGYAPESFLLTGLLLAFYCIMVYLYRHHEEYAGKIAIATFLVLTVEAGSNMFVTSVPTVNRTDYLEDFDAYSSLYDRVQERDPGFYRVEKFERLTQNDAMTIGFPSATLFSSTANGLVKNFYDKYGFRSSKVFYSYQGATPLTNALLSVKYIYSKGLQNESGLYSLVDQEDGIYLYENRYTLPFGYVVSADNMAAEEIFDSAEGIDAVLDPNAEEETENPIILQNELAQHLNLNTELFYPVPSHVESEQSVIEVEKHGYVYAYVNNDKVDTVYSYKNGERTTFKKLKNDYILDLGWHEAGSVLSLESEDSESLQLSAYQLDEMAMERLIRNLSSQPLVIESFSSTKIKGTLQVTSPGQLVLSIPYEPGWTVKLDGQKIEPTSFEEVFLSLPVPYGSHTLELSYFPKGLAAGIAVTLCSILAFVLLVIVSKKREEHKYKEQEEA